MKILLTYNITKINNRKTFKTTLKTIKYLSKIKIKT